MERARKRLQELNIPEDSKIGKALLVLDSKYQELENLIRQVDQLKDDIDTMEHLIMYEINKNNRMNNK